MRHRYSKKRQYNESAEQSAFFRWLALTQPLVYQVSTASGAGGLRSIKEAIRLKAEGLKANFPDIGIFYPAHGKHGLFIEMKRLASPGKPKGVLKPGQRDLLALLRSYDYEAQPAWGWEEAANITLKYLAGDGWIYY